MYSQHGFIRHKSRMTNLLEYFQYATYILGEGDHVKLWIDIWILKRLLSICYIYG